MNDELDVSKMQMFLSILRYYIKNFSQEENRKFHHGSWFPVINFYLRNSNTKQDF
jgi:preprotein translocase subunit SecB